jgi:hypothetical protein
MAAPASSLGSIEVTSHDPHEARAAELVALGDLVGARRVLTCGTVIPGYGRSVCKRRDCPSCAVTRATRNAGRLDPMLATLNAPLVTLVTLTSRGLGDLDPTISALRLLFSRLRRRRCFASAVISGVGALEPHLAASGERWEVHFHLAIEIRPTFDLATVASAWRSLTRGNGRFAMQPQPRLRDGRAFRAYITKPDDWCPPPGTLSPEAFSILYSATRGRRVLISWGLSPHSRNAVVSAPRAVTANPGGARLGVAFNYHDAPT